MKNGFTLIEILVSITIVALISGGVMINLNKYSSRQSLNKSIEEVTQLIKLTQNYAKTRQLPIGSAETELNYISLQIVDGKYLEAEANGVGSTYFHTLVNTLDIGVSSDPSVLYFWPGTGRLVKDVGGTAYGDNEKATYYVQANSDISNFGKIEVNSLGQVTFLGFFKNIK